jgi:hypothetical protein
VSAVDANSNSCRSEWGATDRNRLDISQLYEMAQRSLDLECHDGCMLHKKEPGNATRAGVRKEMAKPRMSRSARIAELNLDTARIPEQPSVTMPGTVDKIIPSPGPSQPEKAQIAVDVADQKYRDLRIENALIDEHGDEVRLKKGAHVEVTVTSE